MGFFKDFKDDLSETASGLKETVADTEPDIAATAVDENVEAATEFEPVVEENIECSVVESQEQEWKEEQDVIVDETAVITASLEVTGDLDSKGSIDIYGSVTGNVRCRGKLTVSGIINGDSEANEVFANNAEIDGNIVAKGTVKVGQGTVIVGDLKALSAVIAGAVKGNIDVNGPVIIDSTAIIVGDIKSRTVQINNGAIIEGRCSQCYAEVNTTDIFNIGKKRK